MCRSPLSDGGGAEPLNRRMRRGSPEMVTLRSFRRERKRKAGSGRVTRLASPWPWICSSAPFTWAWPSPPVRRRSLSLADRRLVPPARHSVLPSATPHDWRGVLSTAGSSLRRGKETPDNLSTASRRAGIEQFIILISEIEVTMTGTRAPLSARPEENRDEHQR